MKALQQKSKVGVAGSFTNQLMGNNSSIPVVGKGATELHYTDRTCYEVIEVSADLKTVKLERLEAKANPATKNDMGHQNWILEPTGQFITVQYRGKGWKTVTEIVTFTKEWYDTHNVFPIAASLTPQQKKAVYGNDIRPRHVVKGITRKKKEYHPIKLLFGVKDYYYDWSF